MMAPVLPRRSHYFAHPAVGFVETARGWPVARTAPQLGPEWMTYGDEEQLDKEAEFFERLLLVLERRWPSCRFRAEMPYGEGARLLRADPDVRARGAVLDGPLTPRSSAILVRAEGLIELEIRAHGEARLVGEPWDGIGLHLANGELTDIRAAMQG